MSEREQKLEAALREALDWIADCHTLTMDDEQLRHALIRKIEGILATPPTREWNEAIEAAVKCCIPATKHSPQLAQRDLAYALQDQIRALKRKE